MRHPDLQVVMETNAGKDAKYCKGYSYILHHSVVRYVVEYPVEKMILEAEDRNTGKVMWENNVPVQMKGDGAYYVHYRSCGQSLLRIEVKLKNCSSRNVDDGGCDRVKFEYRPAVHLGYYIKRITDIKKCWDMVIYGEIRDP